LHITSTIIVILLWKINKTTLINLFTQIPLLGLEPLNPLGKFVVVECFTRMLIYQSQSNNHLSLNWYVKLNRISRSLGLVASWDLNSIYILSRYKKELSIRNYDKKTSIARHWISFIQLHGSISLMQVHLRPNQLKLSYSFKACITTLKEGTITWNRINY